MLFVGSDIDKPPGWPGGLFLLHFFVSLYRLFCISFHIDLLEIALTPRTSQEIKGIPGSTPPTGISLGKRRATRRHSNTSESEGQDFTKKM